MKPNHATSRRNFLKESAALSFASLAVPNAEAASMQEIATKESGSCGHTRLPRIVVHPNGRFLATADGAPFFWLGDTAWQLIQYATRDECSYYLRTRARQGFTVIQTVVLAEYDGISKPTATGLLPFIDGDVRRPNEAFFDRVVELVDEAGQLGLYVGLLPTWGDKLTAPWGAGPRIFRNDNLEDALRYGAYLSRKLKDRPNVLWVLGGDRPPRALGATEAYIAEAVASAGFPPSQDWTSVWRALAEGIRQGGKSIPIITYHPSGGRDSSSFFLHNEPWLSINGIQSGHDAHDTAVWEMIAKDYAQVPPKPTLDLEPNYEDHPFSPWPRWDPATGYFRDYDVRKQVYRSVFAGGCGVTYGHHSIWQFAGKRRDVINHADRDWIDALNRPAGRQVGFLRMLMESRPFFRRIPDQNLIEENPPEGALHLQATRDSEGTYAFIHFPANDQAATVRVGLLSSRDLRAWWFDPRSGVSTPINESIGGSTHLFRTPPYGPDWVLIVEDTHANYLPPALTRVNS